MIDPQIVLYMSGLAASLIMGIVTGFFLRNKRNVSLGKITVGVILILIFSLGFKMGSDTELLNSLPRIGLDAVVIALSAMILSILFVKSVKRVAGLK